MSCSLNKRSANKALAAVSLLLLPLTAYAQRIPTMALVLAALPVVAITLAAALGAVMRSWSAGLLHAALAAVWVAWFVLASTYVQSDLVIWASTAALVLHSLVMVWIIVLSIVRRAVRAVPARERMDRLEFSGHVEHADHAIHVGAYECPHCRRRVEFNTRHFRKHENNSFSNLRAPWRSRFDGARPLNARRWESFLDFHCPGCEAPVRLIYEAGSEWAMGAHGWRVTTILEAAIAWRWR